MAQVNGIDSTHCQTIHARKFYTPQDIAWEARLADILVVKGGQKTIDYTLFHKVQLEEEICSSEEVFIDEISSDGKSSKIISGISTFK